MIKAQYDFSNLIKRTKTDRIDWKQSIGKSFSFVYDNISGELKILDYKRDTKNDKSYILLQYLDKEKWFDANRVTNGNIGRFVGHKNDYSKREKRKPKALYKIGDVIQTKYHKLKIIGCGYQIPKNGMIFGSKKNKRSEIVYDCLCKDCLCVSKKTQDSLQGSCGCPICDNKTIVAGVNDITTTDPWMIDYFQGGIDEAKKYCSTSHHRIYPVCPLCNTIQKKNMQIQDIYYMGKIQCDYCGIRGSYPEKVVFSFLNQLNIEFQSQFRISTKKYDFYLNDYSMIIETHGIQHYEKCGFERYGTSLDEQIENDEYKYDLARKHGIKEYIVLDCRKSDLDWIKQSILNSNLPDILNFTEKSVDWDLCNREALRSTIYDVCYDYMENLMDINQLAEKYNKGRATIVKYLGKGNRCGFCTYYPYWKENSVVSLIYYNDVPLGYTISSVHASKVLRQYNIDVSPSVIYNYIKKNKKIQNFSFKEISDDNKIQYIIRDIDEEYRVINI